MTDCWSCGFSSWEPKSWSWASVALWLLAQERLRFVHIGYLTSITGWWCFVPMLSLRTSLRSFGCTSTDIFLMFRVDRSGLCCGFCSSDVASVVVMVKSCYSKYVLPTPRVFWNLAWRDHDCHVIFLCVLSCNDIDVQRCWSLSLALIIKAKLPILGLRLILGQSGLQGLGLVLGLVWPWPCITTDVSSQKYDKLRPMCRCLVDYLWFVQYSWLCPWDATCGWKKFNV